MKIDALDRAVLESSIEGPVGRINGKGERGYGEEEASEENTCLVVPYLGILAPLLVKTRNPETEVMKHTIQDRSLDAVMAMFAGPFALPTTTLVISL